MSCTREAPPDSDADSDPWSKQLRADLSQRLSKLSTCTPHLPEDDSFGLTLRLVYDEQGRPLSQHVVRADPESCSAVSCIEAALAPVSAPPPPPGRDQYFDLALDLERNLPPTVLKSAADPLTEHTAAEPSCVDPQILKLSREAAEDIIRTAFAGLRACHARAITRDHHASGRVVFEFVIDESGQVGRARVNESTFADCEALECMLAEFRSLRFPAPVGRRLRVLYPIEFAIEQGSVNLR